MDRIPEHKHKWPWCLLTEIHEVPEASKGSYTTNLFHMWPCP